VTVFNHVGLCVTDLNRTKRFYEELLGFVCERELQPPDEFTAPLIQVDEPHVTASYLRKDGFVLELLWFDRPGNPPRAERVMNEPGLTHISICVDDIGETCARVPQFGGTVIEDTNLGGLAVMIRDPDGQLIELLPMSYRDSL
jgi:lactoylglutathione lyase